MSYVSSDISISKALVAEMEAVNCPVSVSIVDTPEKAAAAVSELSRASMVGFDTETRPVFRKGESHRVALMQVSTDEHCYLFRLNRLGLNPDVKRFLEDERIVKIGLSLRDDFFNMHRSGEFEPKGFIELQDYVRRFGIIDCSLQRIYAILFGRRISKGQRLTNWESPVLTPAQQAYAAIDAWACLKIYRYLDSGAFRPEESPYHVVVEEKEDNETLA